MKKIVAILLFITVTGLIGGCSFLYSEPTPTSEAIIDVSEAEEAWLIPEMSGVTQEDEEWHAADMNGEWWLTKTIFTRCPTVCMVMTPNMVQLQKEAADEGLDLQIVSFTVDPEFDTPERLVKYGESYDASFNNWNFITGYSQEEIENFALEALKQTVMKVPEQEDIVHPTRFFLVNPEGQIVRMYSGEEGFDLEASINDLKSLIN